MRQIIFLLAMACATLWAGEPQRACHPIHNCLSGGCTDDSGPCVKSTKKPKVLVVSVNGMEWDFIAPLMLTGQMPNLKNLVDRGSYGKMTTDAHATCPKMYSEFFTSTPTSENGIPGFEKTIVQGSVHKRVRVNTTMLQTTPIWKVLSDNNVSVGMANVPMTYPVQPVKDGYMVSGMLTPGGKCNGEQCVTRLSDPRPGPAVYPAQLQKDLIQHVGDVQLDCSELPEPDITPDFTARWLADVKEIRKEQAAMFEYLQTNYPTDFTWFAQACEDRTGHWLYPIQPFNVNFKAGIHDKFADAFPDQYRQFDQVLGSILQHVTPDTYIFVISDHGIKPLREMEDGMVHFDHISKFVVAHHSFHDGLDVPGVFIAVGPGIRQGYHVIGDGITPLDIAPTILFLYGIQPPPDMKGHALTDIYVPTMYHKAN